MKKKIYKYYGLMILCGIFAAFGLMVYEQEKMMTPEQITFTKKYFDPEKYGDKAYQVALTINKGDVPDADDLKALGKGINQRYGDEITFLFFAIRVGNVGAIDALLANGADPYMVKLENGRSRGDFAYYAASIIPNHPLTKHFGDKLIRLYFKHGGDPNHKSLRGVPIIYNTVFANNFDNFKFIVEKGANPWEVSENEDPPDNVLDAAATLEKNKFIYYALDNKLFINASQKDISRLIYELATTHTQRNDEVSKEIQHIIRLILEETGYSGDGYSAMTLAGETIFNREKRIAKYGKGFGDEGFLDE